MMLAVIGGVAASVGLLGLVFSLRSPAHRLADVLSAVDREPDNRPGQTPGGSSRIPRRVGGWTVPWRDTWPRPSDQAASPRGSLQTCR